MLFKQIEHIPNWVRHIGVNTLGIYAVHVFLINCIQCYKIVNQTLLGNWLVAFVLTAVILLLSLVLISVIKRLSFLRILLLGER